MAIAKALRNVVVEVPEFKSSFALVTDSAETAEDAYEMVKQNPPDILLLDQKLPGMSGIELLEKLVAEQVEVLTIMITAYASRNSSRGHQRAGRSIFWQSPSPHTSCALACSRPPSTSSFSGRP